jgi:hypothetical protein
MAVVKHLIILFLIPTIIVGGGYLVLEQTADAEGFGFLFFLLIIPAGAIATLLYLGYLLVKGINYQRKK